MFVLSSGKGLSFVRRFPMQHAAWEAPGYAVAVNSNDNVVRALRLLTLGVPDKRERLLLYFYILPLSF